jgi:tRNA uridine 5-carbamoylmethylation protein Kti12
MADDKSHADMDNVTQQRVEAIRQLIDGFRVERPRRRWVIVMRGLPGSGKSTLAAQIVQEAGAVGVRATVVSASSYFVLDDGTYRFDRELLPNAHSYCLQSFDTIMRIHNRRDPHYADIVIVDNTNIRLSEYEHYKDYAIMKRDRFSTIVISCRDEQEARVQGSRSRHDVPIDLVVRRYHTFEIDQDNDRHFEPIYRV